MAIDGQADLGKKADKLPVFRSPVAVAVWWLWLLFAIGNLIDLAVQGRDHTSAVAAVILVFVTGIVYVTAQVPRVVARPDSVLIRNPLRDHVISWGSITRVDTLDLLRVRCEWPDGEQTRSKVFHAWAVQHSRRREMAHQAREGRRTRRGLAPSRPDSVRDTGYAASPAGQDKEPALGSPQYAVDSLKARLQEAREQQQPALPPVSTWRWQPIAAIVLPAILLAIVAAV